MRRHGEHVALAENMLRGATGPLAGFAVMFALPILASSRLSTAEFSMWSILNTVATVALTLDFGGTALVMARLGAEPRVPVIVRSGLLSSAGSLLIGLIACLAWIPYSHSAAAGAYTFADGMFAIVVMTAASVVRSWIGVLAQVALNEERFALRNWATAGQAYLFFLFSAALILKFKTAWALPVGWLASSLVTAGVCAVWSARAGVFAEPAGTGSYEEPSGRSTMWGFVTYRTAATLIGAVLLQGDRWIVGAIGGPEFLASYEVAWRVASLPRSLVQNLAAYTGAHGAKLNRSNDSAKSVDELMGRSLVVNCISGSVVAVVVSVCYPTVARLANSHTMPTVFAVLLLALTAHGLTAHLSGIGIGLGIPSIDLEYLSAVLAADVLAALVCFRLGADVGYVLASSLALTAGSVSFLFRGRSRIRTRLSYTGESVPGDRSSRTPAIADDDRELGSG